MKTQLKLVLAISAAVLILVGVAFAYAAPAVAQAWAAQTTPAPGNGLARGGSQSGPPAFGQQGGGGSAGQVTAVSADSLTATIANGQTLTATLSSQTQVTIVATQSTGSLSDIKVGDSVRVMGRPDAAGALTADAVEILPAGDEARGQVTAVNGATLTLQDRGGTTSLVTDSSTIFRLADGKAGTPADVTTGKSVDAFGQKQSDASVLAKLVIVNDQPAGGPMGGPNGGPGGSGAGPEGPGAGQPGAGPQSGGQQPPQASATAQP